MISTVTTMTMMMMTKFQRTIQPLLRARHFLAAHIFLPTQAFSNACVRAHARKMRNAVTMQPQVFFLLQFPLAPIMMRLE
jgi:hypothetical protein